MIMGVAFNTCTLTKLHDNVLQTQCNDKIIEPYLPMHRFFFVVDRSLKIVLTVI